MTDDAQTTEPGPGHNLPPADADALLTRLTETHADLIERRDALLGGIERAPETIKEGDEATAGKMADFVSGQIDKFIKHAEAIHKNEKEPYWTGGKTVDGFLHTLIDDIEAGKVKINRVRKKYADEKTARERRIREVEAARLREEEAARRREADEAAAAAKTEAELDAAIAREAEAEQARKDTAAAEKAAAAKPAELGRTRGQHGGMTTPKQFWNFDGINRDELDLEALRQHLSVDALDKAIRSWINANKDGLKAGEKLAGVDIFEDTRL